MYFALAWYFALFEVPDKVKMSLSEGIEKIYEELCVWDEAATYEGIWKILQSQRKIVNLKGRVYIEFFFHDLTLWPSLKFEGSDKKSAIVEVCRRKLVPSLILLN